MEASALEKGKEKTISFRATFLARQLFRDNDWAWWEVLKKSALLLAMGALNEVESGT